MVKITGKENLDKIMVIVGPTASNKTKVSIEIAKKINGEIVSFDSMQIYKHMRIGSACPTKTQLLEIPHHMIEMIEPNINFNVASFIKMAKGKINEILFRNKIPILVGGTGFYIDALLNGMDFSNNKTNENFKQKMYELCKKKGKHYLHSLLKNIDENSYNTVHENNVKRVVRILEIYKTTGKRVTDRNEEKKIIYDARIYGLNIKRDFLYKRINERVDFMFKNDLVKEVLNLVTLFGVKRDNTSFQAIGNKEILDYIEQVGLENFEIDLKVPNEIIEKIKQKTRNYAKRQFTWFKKNDNINWISIEENTKIDEIVLQIIKNFT